MTVDLISLSYLTTIIYSLIIFSFTLGIFLLSKSRDNKIKAISIIVAARNEENNIPELIKSMESQHYPKGNFELIIVDDRSSDKTLSILKKNSQRYNWLKYDSIKVENTELVGKKGALDKAISMSKNEILAFTDADCLPEPEWLSEINHLMTDETDFICGYSPLVGKGLVNKLKNLERSSIFAVIAGSFGWGYDLTSVARSQVYRKSKFNQIDGFSGIGKYRSGDDDLMLLKMSPLIKKRKFIFKPDAAVHSYDKSNLRDQINLETRRASKWRFYPARIKLLSFFILITYLILTVDLILTISGNFDYITLFNLFIIKSVSEFLLLTVFLSKVKELVLLLYFPIAELIYIPYFLYFGLKGTFGKYQWKN